LAPRCSAALRTLKTGAGETFINNLLGGEQPDLQ
jgi:hypothetical protein